MDTKQEHTGLRSSLGSRSDGSRLHGRRRDRRSRFPHPTLLLGYVVAVVMTVVGLAVLTGLVMHEGVPERFRIMFGIVMTLMGGYRYVLTRTRAMQRRREEEEDDA